ncbi:MAG TPA: hypothetical protein VJV79_21610 [Polyangiaceae bacterium]|nr:hypothetical protein [Polyangiaceae bacterium]
MSSDRGPVPSAARPREDFRLLGLGLLLTPAAVAAAAYALPHVHVASGLADATAFAGAALFPIIGLSLAASVEAPLALALGVAGFAAALLLALFALPPSAVATLLVVVLVDGAQVSLSWALGCSLGRRVQHPAHLFPACVVAAGADIVSLFSPEGPTHAIVESERALSVLAVWFPVPGSSAVAPALGVGDLLFMALAFGVARAHRLPYLRCVVACAAGTALAGVAAAWSGLAIPALLPIAAALVLALPTIRQLRRSDRKAAHWAMLIACSIALGTVARSLLSR